MRVLMHHARHDTTDQQLLDHLRRVGSAGVGEVAELLGVTAPAVRQRLSRLMAEGVIDRVLARQGRGRPSHRYRLTKKGERLAGDNYFDLASILWDEIRQLEDANLRANLMRRIAKRLADEYSQGVRREDLPTRMRELARLMREREVPFEVDESGKLPVINALACPYPDLAEHDRGICTVEQLMIGEIVGADVNLSECRLDGAGCCSFAPVAETAEPSPDVGALSPESANQAASPPAPAVEESNR